MELFLSVATPLLRVELFLSVATPLLPVEFFLSVATPLLSMELFLSHYLHLLEQVCLQRELNQQYCLYISIAAAALFPTITSPPSTQVHSRDAALYIGVGVSGAALLVLIVAPVIVISLIICLRKRQNKPQLVDKTDTVNVTDNVAYGTTKSGIELSGNIAYATTNFKGIDSAYDYVTITGKNDSNIITFTNETNVTTHDQAYVMVH